MSEVGQPVGLVGVGDMGGGIADALLAAGFALVVHDVEPERVRRLVEAGATSAASVAELAAGCGVICLVVVDDEQVREVGSAAVAAAQPGAIVVVHSTVRPTTATALAELAAQRGVALIDAPVSGGSERAQRGLLSVMVGGDDEVVAACWPLLDAIGGHVVHVGPVGSGLAVKLVNNLITIGSYALHLEAMELAAAYGVDEDTVAAVVTASAGDSRLMRTWGRLDRKRHEAGAGTERADRMGVKDLTEAAIAAGLQGVPLPVTGLLAEALPSKLTRRDRELARRPSVSPAFCAVCGQDLAAPFREAGLHPECARGEG